MGGAKDYDRGVGIMFSFRALLGSLGVRRSRGATSRAGTGNCKYLQFVRRQNVVRLGLLGDVSRVAMFNAIYQMWSTMCREICFLVAQGYFYA